MMNRQQPTTACPATPHNDLAQAGWKPLGRLPDGPLDLVGDIHGELDALRTIMARLGYRPDGTHEQGRRIVFLGDLIDRGPESPGVVQLVAELVGSGRALAVMGNHDLNAVAYRLKKENTWLFGHGAVDETETTVSNDGEREEILGFLRQLPVALERDDLRVVHACWDDHALSRIQGEVCPKEALARHDARIEAQFPVDVDPVDRNLALQNENPLKLLTSGPEVRAETEFYAGGKLRMEARHPWWNHYDGPFVVFGHYWRVPVTGIQADDGLFAHEPLNKLLGLGKAMCIDYSVGGRYYDRRVGRPNGPFIGRLAALRWPERELVFDDGERQPLAGPAAAANGFER